MIDEVISWLPALRDMGFWIFAAVIAAPVALLVLLAKINGDAVTARQIALQKKFEAEFAHLPEGERVVKVAAAIRAEKTMIR